MVSIINVREAITLIPSQWNQLATSGRTTEIASQRRDACLYGKSCVS